MNEPETPPEASEVDPLAPLPVPLSITRQQVIDAVKALGVDPDRSSWTQIGPKSIRVLVHIDGTKYPKGLMNAGILVPGTLVEIPIKNDDE